MTGQPNFSNHHLPGCDVNLNSIARPENQIQAQCWDNAISTLWYYLLGPGYVPKAIDMVQENEKKLCSDQKVDLAIDTNLSGLAQSLEMTNKSRQEFYHLQA